MKPRSISLHIEDLVLHGVPAAQRARVGEAMRQELARLMTERGVPESFAAGAGLPHLDAGAITLAPGGAPEAFGVRVAQAVYSSMGKGQ